MVSGDDPVLEFGTRRAQELDAAIWGTQRTSVDVMRQVTFLVPARCLASQFLGHAHALGTSYRDTQTFKACRESPWLRVLLVDTYDILKSGVPNARLRVAKEFGDKIKFLGVRIDRWYGLYIEKVRQQIRRSWIYKSENLRHDLMKKTILNLKMQGAKIDV